MGLSATLSIAQAALQANANSTTVVSKNIAGVNDPNYSRKIASLSTTSGGAAAVTVSRASNTALFNRLLSSTSDSQTAKALSDGLDQLEQTVNLTTSAATSESDKSTTQIGTSPADLLTTMSTALTSYAAAPDNPSLARAFLSDAQSLASNLNTASQTVQSVRGQADSNISNAVDDVNALLSRFTDVNTQIVKGTATGADISDVLDTRDSILASLSKDMGITTTTNTDGSMSIYTDSGVTLFDRTPSKVSFQTTAAFADGTVGHAVIVDGVPITGSSAVMPLASGSIAGFTQLRDSTTVKYQNQLNQVASGLITAFADSDQTGGTAPTIPGLFTYAGAPAMPTTGQTGLAANIKVNSNADPSQGGSLDRMRDGNVGDPTMPSSVDPTKLAYSGNTTNAAAYATHLNSLVTNLQTAQTFDAASGGASSGTLASYAASSVSWLENSRSTATATTTSTTAVATQATTSLSNSTGVNLDDQLSLMLDLEHSYSASAELMSTVNTMFGTLITAMQ